MEEKILEKKVLSPEEIESQSLLELPDRQLLQVTQTYNLGIVATVIKLLFGS